MLIGFLIFGAFNVYIIIILIVNIDNKTLNDYSIIYYHLIILFLDFFILRITFCAILFGLQILIFYMKNTNMYQFIENYIEIE